MGPEDWRRRPRRWRGGAAADPGAPQQSEVKAKQPPPPPAGGPPASLLGRLPTPCPPMAETEEDRELWGSLDLCAVEDVGSWFASTPPLWCCMVHQPRTST
eukprot:1123768-Alexandrium_andersonii.AAC.1